ncbi:MAG: glycerophosphodiester phosphodiesterase [Ferroplasma sp.]|uniref:glycerophosphodiester phosphodiesterase n=1 Tax=Ferroplasma sp. TaxID=2591003 RepID=UPI0028149D8F|nr:glycerophosphodiester phosphodiesterase [Ferroplasma sp.]WMT51162.1 MAG: glycerophosphodiester phosphodiesterase [Ferroplasma sp.]
MVGSVQAIFLLGCDKLMAMDIYNYIKSNFTAVGHRGLPSKYMENTMESFENAFKFTNIVELDVHLSSDNEVFIIHDFNLERLASLNKEIESMNSREIYDIRVGNQKIPRLKDLLREHRDRYFLVELKTVHDDGYIIKNELPMRTLDVIKETGMRDHVCIISFDPYAIKQARELNSTIMLGLDYDSHSEKYMGKIDCRDLESMDVSLYLPEFKEEYIEKFIKIHEAGYSVLPWTVDEPEDAYKICNAGLNGFITNRVDAMPGSCGHDKK